MDLFQYLKANPNQPITLTFSTLMEFFNATLKERSVETEKREYVKGLVGLMEVFKCSKTKAWKIKSSGVIDKAITYTSAHHFLIDSEMALQLWQENERNKKKGRSY